ncbi:hypothetical protein [Pseudomonas sp. Au-Pse12]|uniref:hypothetical protein n=1 Tax=Pseudomonas sp. Au-Pse12 TaxID=2906459 RepID=UPI001E4FDC76|nr:hypothetical protein [Pseudomonas sp. Au-Pse12]MCE4056335.1 hypothetical protein [Pseudomonas sp. Au-Pse12]
MLKEALKSLYKQEFLSLEIIESMLRGRDFEFKPFSFGEVDGFLVEGMGESAFLPARSVSYMNARRGRVTGCQERALTKKIPLPLFIGEGELVSKIHEISRSNDAAADDWLVEIFTPAIASVYLLRYFEKSHALGPYLQIIYESLEAYFIELDHVAIMSLLPVIEGGLRNVQELTLGHSDANVKTAEFASRLGDMIVKHGENCAKSILIYPGSSGPSDVQINFFTHVNPQCDVMNAFRIFFKEVLYRPSNSASDGFNRHLILHLLKNDFASPANYVRVFLLLSHITFCERLNNSSIPMLWPGSDNDSIRVAKYFRELSEKVGQPRSYMWRPGTPLPPEPVPGQ